MWEYSSKNDYPNIILHDCMIVNGRIENQDLVFTFDDSGFWVNKDHPHNPYDQILRTDQSQIRFTDCNRESITIYVFEDITNKKTTITKRTPISLDDMVAHLNKGEWKFENVGEYYAWGSAIFCGYVRINRKPYHIECQMELNYTDMMYS